MAADSALPAAVRTSPAWRSSSAKLPASRRSSTSGQGGRPLTWTGIKPQVTIKYDGETDFSQHLVDINRKPPQELIDGSRPVMRWIEEALETECGMDGLAAAIDEHCSGVQCPALPR